MEKLLLEYLKGRRNIDRRVYKVVSTIYRAERSGRITYEQGLNMIGGNQ